MPKGCTDVTISGHREWIPGVTPTTTLRCAGYGQSTRILRNERGWRVGTRAGLLRGRTPPDGGCVLDAAPDDGAVEAAEVIDTDGELNRAGGGDAGELEVVVGSDADAVDGHPAESFAGEAFEDNSGPFSGRAGEGGMAVDGHEAVARPPGGAAWDGPFG